MCPGLPPDIQQVDDARKTAAIDRELSRLGVDIACLQETRLAGSGTLREESYTFWQGKPPEEPRKHGLGLAVRNTLMTSIEPPLAGTERILTLRLSTSSSSATIISVYAPTLYSTPEDKDQFYGILDDVISQTPSTDTLYLLGDFNARVGADHEAWPSSLGAYGRGKMNDNGQRLLELCCYHGLCHQHIFPVQRNPSGLLETSSFTPLPPAHLGPDKTADCDTDHSLVASKVRIAPRKIHHSKKSGRPRVNTCNASNPFKTQSFLNRLNVILARETSEDDSTDLIWSHLRSFPYGKKEHKNADWFEAHWDEMEPVVEAKRKALLAYKNTPGPTMLTALRVARITSQQTARHCANTYWLNLCSRIQLTADVGDARGMYKGIKKVTGPAPSKSAPLKTKAGDVITDQGKQLERRVEHYLELYATHNVVTDAALADIPDLPVMEEFDTLPTEEELSKAISSLPSRKAPEKLGLFESSYIR
ncbi:uncharacterized protein LOC134769668 [Penaeus indicus]|uniref:uncharacterized protein LOC134769668 n=1 Tax=Penaeus indicus TaxID=29960 RepID=UPI00300C7B79